MLKDAPLETPRLSVRRFRPDDVAWMVSLFADRCVARFVDDGQPLSPADAVLWVERSNANIERFGYGTGVVERREDGAPIGWAGVARPGDGTEEIIYGLARAYWRRGYGGELVGALVDFLAKHRPGASIRATIDPANRVSAMLLSRHGFALAGDTSVEAGTALYIRPPG